MKTTKKFSYLTAVIFSLLYLNTIHTTALAQDIGNIPPDFFSLQNSARDFFNTGRERLEREIYFLSQRRLFTSQKLLTVSDEVLNTPEQLLRENPELQIKEISTTWLN